MWLFLAFLLVPLIEIGLFIQVGGLIGLFPTLAIVVITAVISTWLVRSQGLRAMGDLQGSFNLTTLNDTAKPGRQGGHMTVFEDYEAQTEEFGLLEAGVTLDPNNPVDAAKLDAALLPSTEIVFFRIKNSWGSLRPDREFAPGYPGYHDLYMDYLDGPIKWCPSNDKPTNENCTGASTPLNSVMLPPGY